MVDTTPLCEPDLKHNGFFVDAPSIYKMFVEKMGKRDGLWYYEQIYGLIIPTVELIDSIASLGPILEVGAGTGYLSFLLRRQGVDVVAIDTAPTASGAENSCFSDQSPTWTKVEVASGRSARRYGRRTLLLSWPLPFPSRMASDALRSATGDHLIYIGDDRHCGDGAFHWNLLAEWHLEKIVDLPATYRGANPARFYRRCRVR